MNSTPESDARNPSAKWRIPRMRIPVAPKVVVDINEMPGVDANRERFHRLKLTLSPSQSELPLFLMDNPSPGEPDDEWTEYVDGLHAEIDRLKTELGQLKDRYDRLFRESQGLVLENMWLRSRITRSPKDQP